MKKKILLVCTVIASTAMVGCGGSDKAFAASADMFVNKTVGPEYRAYVMADPALDTDQKADRIRNVDSFKATVKQKIEGR